MKNFNRILKITFLFLCCLFLTVAFSGCSFQGKSAYELAVENGYEGTLSEWLESLKGQDGKDGEIINSLYEEAKENGFTGTFYEFLQQYVKGDKGDKGETGTTAVQYATNKAITSVVSVFCNFTSYSLETYTNAGSGVIYQLDKEKGNAYIITNYHVVFSNETIANNGICTDINVYLYGQEFAKYEITATYIGGSMTYDIAVLKISNSNVLKNSNATQAQIETDNFYAGDTAIAIGNPEGEGISVTSGIVSVDSEYLTMTGADERTEETFRVLRIDTAVNGGNSGGGLFNANGNLIGIVNAKVIDTTVENMGYAIPSTIAVNVADNLIRNHNLNSTYKIQKAVFGIMLQIQDSISQYNAQNGKVDIIQTISIQEVTSGSVADIAGVKVGDKVISYTYKGVTKNVTRLFHLVDQSLQVEQNSTLTLQVLRDNQVITLQMVATNFTEIE